MMEGALAQRFPDREDLGFVRLGKPYSSIFAAAERIEGTRNMVMIGDQFDTDIAGAVNYGLDSALITTGVAHRVALQKASEVLPTYILDSLAI